MDGNWGKLMAITKDFDSKTLDLKGQDKDEG
jgi:hypothetical protein